jgi:hypothetical protein
MRKTVVAITLTIHPSVVGQSHSRTILGPKDNILSIKRDDLAPATPRTKINYTADCMVIVSASGVDDGEIIKVANPAWLHGSPKTRWKNHDNGQTCMLLSPYFSYDTLNKLGGAAICNAVTSSIHPNISDCPAV